MRELKSSRLEKVSKEKSGSRLYTADDVEAPEDEQGIFWGHHEGDDDIENYVYVGEGDLNDIYEESELQEALATYQQVRRALRDQRTHRGWHAGGKGGGKVGFGPPGKGGSFRLGGKGSRIHIESLKLRTKCAKCGVIGHWARECTSAPDEVARNRAAHGGQAKGGASSMTGKSGFVQVGSTTGSHYVLHEGYDFNMVPFMEIPTFGKFYRDRVQGPPHVPPPQFCGLTTEPEFGVVDTAAQSGLIGKAAFGRLSRALASVGLKPRNTNKKGHARGVGGQAVAVGVMELPIGIANVNGILEVTIVEDDVPLLLPVSLLKDLQANIDMNTNTLTLGKFETRTKMSSLPSGHVTVSVMDFDEAGWQVPKEASEFGLRDHEFRLAAFEHQQMQTSIAPDPSNPPSWTYHVAMGSPEPDVCPGERRRARGCLPRPSDDQVEASGDGRGEHHSKVHQGSGRWKRPSHGSRGGGLARKWLSIWLCASACWHGDATNVGELTRAFVEARRVRPDDSAWCATAPSEDVQESYHSSCGVRTSTTEPGRSGQSASTRSMVSGVPQPLEGRDDLEGSGSKVRVQEDEAGLHYSTDEGDVAVERKAIDKYPVVDKGIVIDHGSGRGRTVGGDLSLQATSQAMDGEARGSNMWNAVLQVRDAGLRLLRVGQGAEEAGSAGQSSADAATRSESGSGATQGGDGYASKCCPTEGRGDADEDSGEGSTAARDATISRRGSPEAGGVHDELRGEQASRDPQEHGESFSVPLVQGFAPQPGVCVLACKAACNDLAGTPPHTHIGRLIKLLAMVPTLAG